MGSGVWGVWYRAHALRSKVHGGGSSAEGSEFRGWRLCFGYIWFKIYAFVLGVESNMLLNSFKCPNALRLQVSVLKIRRKG